jgi:hypothetical protein
MSNFCRTAAGVAAEGRLAASRYRGTLRAVPVAAAARVATAAAAAAAKRDQEDLDAGIARSFAQVDIDAAKAAAAKAAAAAAKKKQENLDAVMAASLEQVELDAVMAASLAEVDLDAAGAKAAAKHEEQDPEIAAAIAASLKQDKAAKTPDLEAMFREQTRIAALLKIKLW